MESERPRISIICDLWEQSLAESQHSHLYSGVVTLPLLFVEKLKKKNPIQLGPGTGPKEQRTPPREFHVKKVKTPGC